MKCLLIPILLLYNVAFSQERFAKEQKENKLLQYKFFKMEVPKNWEIANTGMGFRARFRDYKKLEIRALALEGFDFLDPQTILALFGAEMFTEKVDQSQIVLEGKTVTRITYTDGENRKSWWIIFKREGAIFLLVFKGENSYFEGEKAIFKQILHSFKFIPRDKIASKNLKITSKNKLIEHNFFNAKFPNTWEVDLCSNKLFASSKVAINGKNLSCFVLVLESRGQCFMDLSLIPLLFRVGIVKDPTMKVTNEGKLNLPKVEAEMIELVGGPKNNQKKIQIIALKHEFTRFVVVIRGPKQIWDANPQFAKEIIQNFEPK